MWLSVHRTNAATCGCDNEITVKHDAYRAWCRWMIPHLWLILLQEHNECHLANTMNVQNHTFSKVLRKGSGEEYIVMILALWRIKKKSNFSFIISLLFMHFTPADQVFMWKVVTPTQSAPALARFFSTFTSFSTLKREQKTMWWPLRGWNQPVKFMAASQLRFKLIHVELKWVYNNVKGCNASILIAGS